MNFGTRGQQLGKLGKTMVLRTSKLTMIAALAAVLVTAPATAAAPAAYNPWVSLSAFASRSSAAQLANRPACRTEQEVATAVEQRRAGQLPFCILTDDQAAGLLRADQATAGVTTAGATGSIGTVPLLLGLAALLGVAVLALGGGNSGDDIVLQPITPA